jgi:hypothetical protein
LFYLLVLLIPNSYTILFWEFYFHILIKCSNNKILLYVYLGMFLIIIGKNTISFMQSIYTYIPETNHVPKEYNVHYYYYYYYYYCCS